MAQKRINKNLVAFLTVMGIVLTVSIVAIGMYQGAKKDPEEYARQAKEFEDKKDLTHAAERYHRAFDVSKDAKYEIEAARCAYQSGEIRTAVEMLINANLQDPSNKQVLESLVRHTWQLRDVQFSSADIRDFATKLLAVDKDNVLGLVCKSAALRKLATDDPQNVKEADELLEQAYKLAPDDPEVAIQRAEQAYETARKDLLKNPSQNVTEAINAARAKSSEVLLEAARKNLKYPAIITRAAQLLGVMSRLDEAEDLLRKSVEANPADGEVLATLGRVLAFQTSKAREKLPPEEYKKRLEEARGFVKRGIEIEPALYGSYADLAKLTMMDEDKSADAAADLGRRSDAALKLLETAIDETDNLRSVAASLNARGRPQLYLDAFQTAMDWYNQTLKTEEKTAILARARAIFEKASAAYSAWHVPPYMEALLNIADGNMVGAIQLLEKTNDRYGQPFLPAHEKLALLYREIGQPGEALKYADATLRLWHEGMRQAAPKIQYVNKAQVLVALNRAQEALNFINDLGEEMRTDERLMATKAEALRMVGRGEEAQTLLAGATKPNRTIRLEAARQAALQNDHDKAESIVSKVIEEDPNDLSAVRLYCSVMIAANRRDKGAQYIQALEQKSKDEAQKRVLKAMELTLSITDDAERDAALVKLIQQSPDPFERAADLFNYYSTRGQYEKAAEPLAELEKLRPDSSDILEKQFLMALVKKEYDKAEKYSVKLAAANADSCKGATYRGRLEYARGDFAKAVLAFRDAEQLRPADSELKVLLAQALALVKPARLDDAIEALKAAVQFNPVSFEAHKLLFMAYNEKGDEENAKKHLRTAAELNPDDPFVRERKQILDEEKDPKAGIASREKRRAEKPDDVDNIVRLASLYETVNNAAAAEKAYRDALAAAPKSLVALRGLSVFLATNGKLDQTAAAIAEYNKSADPADQVTGHMLYAYCAEKVGDQAGAFESLKSAERAAAAIPDADKRRKSQVDTGLQVGEFCYRLELTKEMIGAFRRVLDVIDKADVPTVQRIRLRIMQGMFVTQRFSDVEQEIAAYLKDYPDDGRGLTERGRLQVARGQLEEARATYTQILDKSPDDANGLFMRGSVNIDLHRYVDGIADLLRVKRLKPDGYNFQHRIRLAQAYEANGDLDAAESELRELVTTEDVGREPIDRLIRLYQRTKRLDKAQLMVREYISKHPQQPQWHYQLGRVLIDQKDYSSAVEPLRKALELAGLVRVETAAPICSDLMLALTKTNRHAEVVNLYNTLPEKIRVAMVKSRVAEAQFRLGQTEKASGLFEDAIRSGAAEGWASLIRVARLVSDALPPEQAVALFKKVADAAPQTVELGWHYQAALAQLLVRLDKRTEALAVVDGVLPRVPAGSRLRVGLLEIKGDALLEKPEEQVRVYEQILLESPDNLAALNNIAYVKADRLNQPQEAIQYAERAREKTGPDPNVLDTLGWARFKANDLAGAESALRDALRLEPDNGPALLHMGRLLAKQGQSARARESLDRAMSVANENKDNELGRQVQKAIEELH